MSSDDHDRRPPLDRHISAQDFRDFYWLKTELQEFCLEHDLSTAGGKQEIAARISTFLLTGRRVRPSSSGPVQTARERIINDQPASSFTLWTRAPIGFRCTEGARSFFLQQLGPSFRFTVPLQRYIREHPGVTFGEIAEEWKRQNELRQRGELREDIASQFEYNRFTRDFFSDPANAKCTRADCIREWKQVRSRRGDNMYRPKSGARGNHPEGE